MENQKNMEMRYTNLLPRVRVTKVIKRDFLLETFSGLSFKALLGNSYLYNSIYLHSSVFIMNHPILIGFAFGNLFLYGFNYLWDFLFTPMTELQNEKILTDLTNHYGDVKNLKLSFSRLANELEVKEQEISNLVETMSYNANKLNQETKVLMTEIQNKITHLERLEIQSKELSLTVHSSMRAIKNNNET